MPVGRFQVMAILQAARAEALGLPAESAKSWGLNRAIFYAAAKRGFRGKPGGRPGPPHAKGGAHATEAKFELGDDYALSKMVRGRRYFTIGGETQTPEGFDKQIESRFGSSFPAAWNEAKKYVDGFPKDVLLSKDVFFSDVYRPKRDELAERWTAMSARSAKKTART